jgi:hypothetical protein
MPHNLKVFHTWEKEENFYCVCGFSFTSREMHEIKEENREEKFHFPILLIVKRDWAKEEIYFG